MPDPHLRVEASDHHPEAHEGVARMPAERWLWWATLLLVGLCVAHGYHQYPAATFFGTDDYIWRLWAVVEPRPWRAFVDDLCGGQCFRPLRYLCWYGLERANQWVPGIHPWAVLAGFALYGYSAALLATQLSHDRWVGLSTGMLALLCPILGRSALTWYSVLEDMVPPALLFLSVGCVVRGNQTSRRRWLVPAVVTAVAAALWKENAFVLPALVWLTLLTHPGQARSVHPQDEGLLRGAWARLCSLFSAWSWWVPLLVVLAGIWAWRYAVFGGSGLIGHHGLLRSDFKSVFDHLTDLLGLVGSAPIGSFYLPAIERSFPTTFSPRPGAWTVEHQMACLVLISLAGFALCRYSGSASAALAGVGWYLVSWFPALALTVLQPSYLFLPNFGVFFLVGLSARKVTKHPAVFSLLTMAAASWLGWDTALDYRAALVGAEATRREVAGLLDMTRRESERLPEGTRVFLLHSEVLRPDLIAEFDAACSGKRCPLDLFNFAAPVEIVVPLQPPPTLPPALRIVTEGLREGRIKLADRELYFTTLTGSMQKLADPQLDNRFWIHGQTGWADVTEAVYHGRMRL